MLWLEATQSLDRLSRTSAACCLSSSTAAPASYCPTSPDRKVAIASELAPTCAHTVVA